MLKGMRLSVCAAFLAALPGVVFAGTVTELKSISVTAADDGARVLLDASAVTSYRLFTLDKPDRVVIDLRNTRRGRSVRLPASRGVIDTVRTGERPGGTLRVVLQLKRALPARALWIGPEAGNGAQFIVNVGRE